MSDSSKIHQAVKPFCEKIKSVVDSGSEISIVTHLDADGITSGSIIAIALARMGGKCSVRAISDFSLNTIDAMKSENHDFYIITDLGGGMGSELYKALDKKWIVVDHHQIPENEMITDDNDQILNAWKYGIDGGREVAAGGMAYIVAESLDRKNRDLSSIAVISAVADRQDHGENKSFTGVNAEILNTAKSLDLVGAEIDILLTGRETRPLYESLAHTTFPYIDGLTWNRENCYALLKDAGIKMKESGRWRVLSEISQEEKSAILDAVAKFVATSSNSEPGIINDLVGNVYTLTGEDKRSQLRDAREFSTLLNACGRIGKAGIGIAICMGDRNRILSEGEDIMSSYRTTLRNYLSTIFAEKWRLADDGKHVFVNGDGLLEENMLGAVSSLLSGSPTLGGRLLFVRTLTKDGIYKFSSRKCLGCKSEINLGLLMRHCAESASGKGGGHSSAAGCSIPLTKLEDFMVIIKGGLNDSKFASAS